MPESFDGMLAELADAAAAATPLPDVSRVRRRAHERTVHRRLAASTAALVLLGTCGGTLAAAYGHFTPKANAAAVAPGTTAKVTAPARPPGTAGFVGASPTTDTGAALTADAVAFASVAGTWRSDEGDRYLIVFPDGGIGVGEAGAWQLCDGQLTVVGSGVFDVAGLPCGDAGTTALTLQSTAKGTQLSLLVPASGSTPGTLVYQRTAGAPTATASHAVLAKLVGTWASGAADKRQVLVAGDGSVSLVGLSDSGAPVDDAGAVTAYYTDGVRVQIACPSKPGMPTSDECGVVELEWVDAKQITVVGSGGSETFLASGGPAAYTTVPTSGTAVSSSSFGLPDPVVGGAPSPSP